MINLYQITSKGILITHLKGVNHPKTSIFYFSICCLLFHLVGRLIFLFFLSLLLSSLFNFFILRYLLPCMPSLAVLDIFGSFSFRRFRIQVDRSWSLFLFFIIFFLFSIKASSKSSQQRANKIVSFAFVNRTI